MKTILHNLDIQAPAEEIFAALTEQAGLSGWWTPIVEAEERVGGIVDFTFGAEFNPKMEITALEPPHLVAWRCIGGHEPWIDNRFSFRIETRDAGCVLFFEQQYARELSDEAYGRYNFNWGFYLESLRALVETGRGKPYERARKGS